MNVKIRSKQKYRLLIRKIKNSRIQISTSRKIIKRKSAKNTIYKCNNT